MALEAFSLVGRIALQGGDKVKKGLEGISGKVDDSGKKMGGLRGSAARLGGGLLKLGGLAAGAAAGGIATLGTVIGGTGIHFNAMKEQSQVAWTTLLGTADAADKMIGRINDFAAATPFATENVDMMAKYMHNAGYEGQAMFDQLMKISDTASAFAISADGAQEMARQMSQVQQAGVAYTEDLNILQDRGIPIFKAIAEEQGIMVKDVKKMASEGKISADIYNAAFDRIAGGVEGASDAQSKTLNGMISTLKDNFSMLAGTMTEGGFAFLKDLLPPVIEGIGRVNELLQEGGWEAVFKEFLPPDVAAFIISTIDTLKGLFGGLFGGESTGQIATFIGFIKQIGSTFSWVWEIIKFAWGLIAPFIADLFIQIQAFWAQYGEPFKLAVVNAFKMIQKIIEFAMPLIKWIIEDVFSSIKNIIQGAVKIIMGIIKVFIGIFTGDFSLAWEGVKQIFSGALQAVWGFIKGFLLGKIVGAFKFFGKAAAKPFADVLRVAKHNFTVLKTFVKRIIDGIVNFFKNLGSKLKFNIPKPKLPIFKLKGKLDLVPPDLSVPKLSVDWRAKGGFLNGAQLIGAGEVDEAILPTKNRKNMQPFAMAVAENLASLRSGGLSRLEVPISLNGREILRAIIPDLDRELARKQKRSSGLVNRGVL